MRPFNFKTLKKLKGNTDSLQYIQYIILTVEPYLAHTLKISNPVESHLLIRLFLSILFFYKEDLYKELEAKIDFLA